MNFQIGLPPTRDELAAFLTDTSDDAYEKVVERLLKSGADVNLKANNGTTPLAAAHSRADTSLVALLEAAQPSFSSTSRLGRTLTWPGGTAPVTA